MENTGSIISILIVLVVILIMDVTVNGTVTNYNMYVADRIGSDNDEYPWRIILNMLGFLIPVCMFLFGVWLFDRGKI